MDQKRHLADINSLVSALRRQQWLSACLVLAVLALAALQLGKKHTVVLEPPTRAKSIAMTGDRVDAAWLEEMGSWVATELLTASPQSIESQQQMILRWAHPSTHAQLAQDMAIAAKRLVDSNAATVFWLQQAAPDPERQRVALLGLQETYVNGVRVQGSSRNVAYLAEFESLGGRVLLKSWKPAPNDDIFLARLTEAAAKANEALTRKLGEKH